MDMAAVDLFTATLGKCQMCLGKNSMHFGNLNEAQFTLFWKCWENNLRVINDIIPIILRNKTYGPPMKVFMYGILKAGTWLHAEMSERIWYYSFRTICGMIFFFLIFPILVMFPLSFNAEPYFTFTPEMLSLDPAGFSTQWYEKFFTSSTWQAAVRNSLVTW